MPREMQRSGSEAQSSNGSIWQKEEVWPGGSEDGSRKQQKEVEQKREQQQMEQAAAEKVERATAEASSNRDGASSSRDGASSGMGIW